MKREFLVQDSRKLHEYLHENSLTCKLYKYEDKNSYMYDSKDYTYVLEEYKKPLNLDILVIIFKEEIILDETTRLLKEVTGDIRYSKDYLILFGNPKNYEFDEKRVFEKCEKAGISRLDLHFKMEMSSTKVFRVVLYRLNQLFILEYEMYIKQDIEYEDLEKSHKKLIKALNLSKKLFDKKIIKQILNDAEDLYMLLNHQETFEKYVLNFQMFVYEDNFYVKENTFKPIHFFNKKEKLFELL